MGQGSYTLERQTTVPVDIEKAWEFFSDPRNLSVITPPEMKFSIVSDHSAAEFFEGMHIAYTVRPVAGIPMRWVSRIEEIVPKRRFVDVQIQGPYRSWRHVHTFDETPHGVSIRDVVHYSLPFGWLGRLFHRLFIRRKLNTIFDYRAQVISRIFGN